MDCKHLDKAGRFYLVGRLASISSINILYEKNDTWTELKNMVNSKPYYFLKTWFEKEISQVMDEEELGRLELHKEVIFFHQVLEEALDYLLDALFAINDCNFPRRKRTMSAIDGLQCKPQNCYSRLLTMVLNGGTDNTTINKAIDELRSMTNEIYELSVLNFHLNSD